MCAPPSATIARSATTGDHFSWPSVLRTKPGYSSSTRSQRSVLHSRWAILALTFPLEMESARDVPSHQGWTDCQAIFAALTGILSGMIGSEVPLSFPCRFKGAEDCSPASVSHNGPETSSILEYYFVRSTYSEYYARPAGDSVTLPSQSVPCSLVNIKQS